VSVCVFVYENRPAFVRPFVTEICIGPKGLLVPITFSNDGKRVGVVQDVFVTALDVAGRPVAFVPVVVTKPDHIPFIGTKGHADSDDIQGIFTAFAVPPESSITESSSFRAGRRCQARVRTARNDV